MKPDLSNTRTSQSKDKPPAKKSRFADLQDEEPELGENEFEKEFNNYLQSPKPKDGMIMIHDFKFLCMTWLDFSF